MSADRIARAAHAAEQLSSVLWEAVHEKLSAGCPVEVAALTDRIAQVCASVSAVAALDGADAPVDGPDAAASGAEAAVERPDAALGRAGDALQAGMGASAQPLRERFDARRIGGVRAELIDEHGGAATPIAIRDVRGMERSSWVEAVQRRLDRHADDGERFAVLLFELLDEERGQLAQRPAGGHVHLGDMERMRDLEGAIVDQLRPADALLRESEGRYWLIAPQTDIVAARLLAERIAAAVRRHAGRGAWPQIAAGIAICPEHGRDAAALVGHADVDLHASQAAARRANGGEPLSPL